MLSFSKFFFLSGGYYGGYIKGTSENFYNHISANFQQQFKIPRFNHQNFFVLGGGFNFKTDERLSVRAGGKLGFGNVRVTGDLIPDGFVDNNINTRFVFLTSYSEVIGTHKYGFIQLYLNFNYRI